MLNISVNIFQQSEKTFAFHPRFVNLLLYMFPHVSNDEQIKEEDEDKEKGTRITRKNENVR